MNRTQISSVWKIFLAGGCAAVALCGGSVLALFLVSAWTTPIIRQPVASDPTPVEQPAYASPAVNEPVLQTVGDVLTGHQWRVRSETLGGRDIEAVFKPDGSFEGIITASPDDPSAGLQQVVGKWTIAGPLLYMDWDWTQYELATHEQIPIQITEVYVDKVQGIDRWYRLWEFERIDTQ